ncbi:MAG: nucleotidyltransferase domain-containing protein [Planctomycetaceae bacterium]|nr:nucleotidyltransferase domain-containing protein [Planctomycetaceae bacterium]
MTSSWAQDRDCPFPATAAPQLAKAWSFSRDRLQQLVAALQSHVPSAALACVAVSGSLARMESHEESDIDLLVVVDDQHTQFSPRVLEDIYDDTWSLVSSALPQPPPRPMSGGIFSECVSWRQLVDESVRGRVDEPITPYGQRMQLLLDAQPVWGHSRFAQLQATLLDWYTDPPLTAEFGEDGPFHWLTQEIHRYWRSIRARACWLFADQPVKAVHVNTKLRSSRLLLIATFLDAIRRCHQADQPRTERIAWLAEQCQRPPLERIAQMLPPEVTRQLLSAYEQAWLFTQQSGPEAAALPVTVQHALQQLGQIFRSRCQLDI